jgi:hypothetical protein
MINDPHRLDDRLKVFTALSFAVSVVLNLLLNNGGETGRIIANFATIFGLLTLVLVIALIVRTFLRWRRRSSKLGHCERKSIGAEAGAGWVTGCRATTMDQLQRNSLMTF